MTAPQRSGKVNKTPSPPYKVAAVVSVAVLALVVALVYMQFRGEFTPMTRLTMVADRAGLVMDPGAPVTFNRVQIGRVDSISEVQRDGQPAAKFALDVHPRYVKLIPANVQARILATTVFGNKFVSLAPPKSKPGVGKFNPATDVIDVRNVTTEFNTLFQTITDISEKVDPVKLNLTVSAAAQALAGLGDKFGASLVNANTILDDINPKMGQIRSDIQKVAALGDVYADASPDLWDALANAVTAARTLHEHEDDLDEALLAAVGFGNTGEDIFTRGGPYLTRGMQDLVITTQLLDEYSPEYFCTLRNMASSAKKVFRTFGGSDRFALDTNTKLVGAPNPYLYPENLGRVNVRGGPGGAPGCWQEITKDLWPAPYLVVDDGANLAPYNHFEIGQPTFTEYVWGRQFGEYSINP